MDQENNQEKIQAPAEMVKEAIDKTEVNLEPTIPSKVEKPTKKKLTKKQKVAIVSTIIVVLLISVGIGLWYFLSRTTEEEAQNDQEIIKPAPPVAKELALKDNNLSDFDLTFLKLNNNSENIIYSPLSIKYALAMLSDAAAGESKTQINTILGKYQPKAYLNSANRSLANAMFVRTNSEFSNLLKESYTDTIKTNYNASVVYDSFESPDNANGWVSEETLGIINDLFSKDNFNTEKDFALVNALAIDMKWQYQLQCTFMLGKDLSKKLSYDEAKDRYCKHYSVEYPHEEYYDGVNTIWNGENYSKISFNGKEDVATAEIGASANRYDIIKELGEEHIRKTVLSEHEKWLQENDENRELEEKRPFSIDEYMKELSSSYNRLDESTDFAFYDSENERVFAKDLREYDGSTLQYVGIMPKTEKLNKYINNLTAEYTNNLIKNLKVSSDINSYKEGVATKIHAYIPFFKYNYSMEKFKDNLYDLGIADVFNKSTANLSNMVNLEKASANAYIMDALHKADIEFSNDGIKAAATTALVGGLGATGGGFDYKWEVPVEEIDLTFDKPFLFIIRDKASGEVWFTGAVYNI